MISIFSGAKFWKSAKVIKAIKEGEYRQLDSSKKVVSKNLPVFLSSSSDSDTNQPLLRKRRQDDVQAKFDVRLSSLQKVT